MLSLPIRSPTGASACSLPDDATLLDLQTKIQALTAIAPERQDLRSGFPPKAINTNVSPDTLLSSCGIRSGETIIVAESASTKSSLPRPASPASVPPLPAHAAPTSRSSTLPSRSAAPQPSAATTSSSKSVEVDGGYLVLRIVPDDNSCLFTALSLVFNPSSPPNPSALRRTVADTIRSDPSTYSEVLLGRPSKDYIDTILSPKSWGGAIELAILSSHFGSEIWSIDVQSGRIDKFGEGSGHQTCVFVVYSGIHYDALTFSFAPPSSSSRFPPDLSFDTTIFPLPVEPTVLSAAQTLVETLRKSHSYTDTATFTLRCEICREAIVGEKEARQHASQTGHQSFGEFE